MNNTPSNSAVFSDNEVAHAIAMMITVMAIGSIGNTLVIFVLCLKNSSANSRWNQYRRRNQTIAADSRVSGTLGRDKTLDFFILVLAISDLLVCVIIIPSTITMEVYRFRISIDVLCKLFYVIFVANTTFSSLLISAVALDRYLFICHSLKHILTLIRAKILVSSLALFSLGVGIAAGCVVGVKTIPFDETAGSAQPSYICEENEFVTEISELQKIVSQIIKYLNHACFIACILIVIILYSCVFWAIVISQSSSRKLAVFTSASRLNGRNSSESGKSLGNSAASAQRVTGPPSKLRQKAQFTLQNLRSALMLFIIALVYIFTFVPSLVIANGWAQQNLVLLYIYYVNSAANPCIYAIFTPSFRQIIAHLLRSCFNKGPLPTSNGRNSLRSDASTPINDSHTNTLVFSRIGKKQKITEQAYPFISREERMKSAVAKAAAPAVATAAATVSHTDSNWKATVTKQMLLVYR